MPSSKLPIYELDTLLPMKIPVGTKRDLRRCVLPTLSQQQDLMAFQIKIKNTKTLGSMEIVECVFCSGQ